MPRGRLRVVFSSDEEDEDIHLPPPPPPPQQQQDEEIDDIIINDIENNFETVTLNSGGPTPNSNNSATASNPIGVGIPNFEPIPLDISDEDEENATMNHRHLTNNSISNNGNSNNSCFEVSESPVHGVLEKLGLRLRREWLNTCLDGLQMSVQGFQRMEDSAKAKLCFEQFLWSDMNYCGAGVLPPNVHSLHLVDLKGPFVLQVDEIINISSPLRGRYQNAAAGIKRCLKLSMTDGVQRVFGIEYRPIKDLTVPAPAGLKVAVCNVNIRHGLLMLVPEVIEVLGGTVEELEAARQRLVNEINKPPRGKRNTAGMVPPLATRATLAAWPPSNDSVPGNADRTRPVNSMPPQASGQGSAASIPTGDMHRQDSATPFNRNNAEGNMSDAARPQAQEQDNVPRHTDMPTRTHLQQGPDRPRKDFEVPVSTYNAEPNTFSGVQPVECVTILQRTDELSTEVMPTSGGIRQGTTPGIPANHLPGEDVNIAVSRDNAEPNTSSIGMDIENISMEDEPEHHFILQIEREIPFTYLASLSAKSVANDDEASFVRGKIKCFLTGVKGFQYKQRTTYELRVYVDDGSLISEILIDHNVVQNGIGCSPMEVTRALASSESKRVSEMKETLKQFQIFLVNFEGTMVVEMSKASPVPLAVEMNQGCSASDAWLLLKRFKSLSAARPCLDPIELSP